MTARRLLLAALLALVAPAAAADRAYACSCADFDPRDRLEAGEPAFIGRVVSAPPRNPTSPLEGARYVVRVERALGARLGHRIVIRSNPYSSCGVVWEPGQRVGAFLNRTSRGWTTNLCSLANPCELEQATRPYPRPLGRGRVALLAGGSFGDARVLALDRRGRILGYGFGEGSVRRISVCPGSAVAAELVDRGRARTFVAVRSLESLQVLTTAEVPRHTDELACADPAGATVYAGGILYGGRPVRGRAEVHRITASTRARLVRRTAERLALVADAAYMWSGRRLIALELSDGGERTLLRMGIPEHIVPSPFGGRLAVQGIDGRLRMVDLATGAVASRRLPSAWAFAWLAPDRLLARIGVASVTLDGALRRQRRYARFRGFPQAPLEDAVYGTDRYRLTRLDLASGRERTAARLPDRGIADLVGVPEGAELHVPRRAPRVLTAPARRAWNRPICDRRRRRARAARCGTAPARRRLPGAPGRRGCLARDPAAARRAAAA
jgi:hypothetical protein